jgi:D-sedoheptulose 7-phosphate isomerase
MNRPVIKAAFFDIDGVLTDGTVYVDSEGREVKRISFEDIDAIFTLKRRGIKIGFITGENTSFIDYVKRRFQPDYIITDCKDKLAALKKLLLTEGLNREAVCYVGDSEKDMEVLNFLDRSFAPADADPSVKGAAKFITISKRGSGVIREVCHFLLTRDRGSQAEEKRDATSLWKTSISKQTLLLNSVLENASFLDGLSAAARAIVASLKNGGKILICGNGGSAADAQHFAAELAGRFLMDRTPLNAEALTVNTSSLTAIANDYGYDSVFARQVEAKGRKDDVLIAISTSGSSTNVIDAVVAAKRAGMITIGLTGDDRSCSVRNIVDHCVSVPSRSTPRIQEIHILILHMMCEFIETELFGFKEES